MRVSAMTLSADRDTHCAPVAGEYGAVSAGHPLAVAAGTSVLAEGGSAVDAAIAAQAVTCVCMPHSAGLGGDMLALVREAGGEVFSVNGTGRSGLAAEAITSTGGASVTVPGLVAGWVHAHRRWGRLTLARVLSDAIRIARQGFDIDSSLVLARDQQRERLVAGGAENWPLLRLDAGDLWRQEELARFLTDIADSKGESFYTGSAVAAMTDAVQRSGGSLTARDFELHTTQASTPVTVDFDGGRLSVQPPSSQGVLLALAATAAERLIPTVPENSRDHLLVEITEAVFAHRSECGDAESVLAQQISVDPERAAHRGGPRAYLHTAGVAAADASGMVVSSLVSVFDDFGSCVFVPELGISLNNRAAGFTDGANAAGPGKRPVHTLAPALLQRSDGSVLAMATPGADGQVQTLLQILVALGDGEPLGAAIAAPRWRSENNQLMIERDHLQRGDLGSRGHHLKELQPGNDLFGAVVAAGFSDGKPFAAADWRRQVSAAGI
ncbi:gamma-glutamyltransferase [Nakamurella antarctica]|uniref:Gamma-glutamyltransferase n=1 Tax=Nakamurella antarctica TaxID=1902245 RepID=A0A3G8ZS54_9ACTN|nr:gamma-glutamyltransferase [Nakamurella antarctica]AZI56906.1 gamma-glutamyltransferase [Nakamurella antarctica]